MKFFGKRGKQAAPQRPVQDPFALPPDLALCLETMSVVERSPDDDGRRCIVQMDSCGGWVHREPDTRAQLLRRWPSLSDGQIRRALRHIDAAVRKLSSPPQNERRCWATHW